MSRMDFRYYNKTTQQWEKSVAQGEDFNDLVKTVNAQVPEINKGVDVYSRYKEYAMLIPNWNIVKQSGIYIVADVSYNPTTDLYYGEYIAYDDDNGILKIIGARMHSNGSDEYYKNKINGVWDAAWRRQIELRDMGADNIATSPFSIYPARTTLTQSLTDIAGKTYDKTNISPGIAYYDTGISSSVINTFELFYTGSPNSGGSGAYRASNMGYLSIAESFNNNAYTRNISYIETYKKICDFGGMQFAIDVFFININDGTTTKEIYTSDTGNWNILVAVSGFYETYEGLSSYLKIKMVGA